MSYNANLNTYTFERVEQLIDKGFPCNIESYPIAMGNGELKKGTVVAFNSAGAVVEYDPDGEDPVNKPFGVLANNVDTDNQDVAPVIVFGRLHRKAMLVKGEPISDELFASLRREFRSLGIYIAD